MAEEKTLNKNTETAYFAAGCFWGVEANFEEINGVVSAVSGYAGGSKQNPSYRQVCSGKTGHAETVKVIFNLKKITYIQLLDAFWTMHDPTTLNRQGPDIGSQYRSVIFYINEQQKAQALQSLKKAQNSGKYKTSITTEIVKFENFYPAEEYHQDYYKKHNIKSCGYNPANEILQE